MANEVMCPYCGEMISEKATVCRHCGRMLTGSVNYDADGTGVWFELRDVSGVLSVGW